MRDISAAVYPVGVSTTVYLTYPQSTIHVHAAPGHYSVVLDVSQQYKKTRRAKKQHTCGLRIELSKSQVLQLIEALAEAQRSST